MNTDPGKEPAFFSLKDMVCLVEIGVRLTYCKHTSFSRLVMNMTQDNLYWDLLSFWGRVRNHGFKGEEQCTRDSSFENPIVIKYP